MSEEMLVCSLWTRSEDREIEWTKNSHSIAQTDAPNFSLMKNLPDVIFSLDKILSISFKQISPYKKQCTHSIVYEFFLASLSLIIHSILTITLKSMFLKGDGTKSEADCGEPIKAICILDGE